jgi:hypothetical protein
MDRPAILLTMLGVFGAASFAFTPVATVSSLRPFTLDGHSISATGVASWPLVVGDEIATSTAPATISFQDGSRISLASKSGVKIGGTNLEPTFVLVTGSLDYRLVKGSKVSLAKLQDSSQGQPTTYSVTSFGKRRVAPVMVAAGAAGIAAPAVVFLAAAHGASATGASATLEASNPSVATAGSASTASSPAAATPTATTASAASDTSPTASSTLLKVPPLSHFQ